MIFFFNQNRKAGETSDYEEDSSVFLSIGDLMSGLLMIFMLLFVNVLIALQEAKDTKKILVTEIIDAARANNIDVQINPETGDISVKESILFDFASAKLKPEGKTFLNQFIPTYSQIILSRPDFDEAVKLIVIEGHTSSKGKDEENMLLSLERANAVVTHILSSGVKVEDKPRLMQKIIAAGRGEIEADQTKDSSVDRRVLFRFEFAGDTDRFISVLENR
jgi:outer membrane protein OmpA-like peptidoglycan-associated protein